MSDENGSDENGWDRDTVLGSIFLGVIAVALLHGCSTGSNAKKKSGERKEEASYQYRKKERETRDWYKQCIMTPSCVQERREK